MYVEHPAAPHQAGRVACVWTRIHAEAHVQRVVPDACVDVIWAGTELFVAGPDTAATLARTPGRLRGVGVRFRPGQAAGVLGVPADALRDARIPLAELWGADAERIGTAVAGSPDPERTLEALVLDRAAHPWATGDARAVLRTLCPPPADGGPPTVARAAADLGHGERQLRRRCLAWFGYGPKTLQRIVRFQRALRRARVPDADFAEVAFATGYADQAHLAREVRTLGGVPLTELADRTR